MEDQKQTALYEQYKLRRAKTNSYRPNHGFVARVPLTRLDCVTYRLATGASANYNQSRHVSAYTSPQTCHRGISHSGMTPLHLFDCLCGSISVNGSLCGASGQGLTSPAHPPSFSESITTSCSGGSSSQLLLPGPRTGSFLSRAQ